MNTQSISREDLEGMSSEELAELFKDNDIEVCLEPLSEWGSDMETLFHKLEKGVMQWYEAGIKRSFTVCFLDQAVIPAPPPEEEASLSTSLSTATTLS
jgi:hypothetical protein